MIIVRADTRHATCTSDDAITTGSVGIQVKFMLSGQFNGLSAVAVFRSTGASVDVALMSNTCVVPPEVLRASGAPLYIGVYARNSAGTVVIPTVWTATKDIQPGTRPSGVNPSEPTPDWTAQVQLAAQEAVQTSERAITIASGAQEAAEEARQSASEAAGSATAAAGSAAAAAVSEAAAREVEESIPADYTDLSNDVSDLKSQMNKVDTALQTEIDLSSQYSDGYVIKTNYAIGTVIDLTPTTSGAYGYILSDCAPGDQFILKGQGGDGPRLWAFVDGDNKLLAVADAYAVIPAGETLTITAPSASAALIYNANHNAAHTLKKIELLNVPEEIDSIKQRVTTVENAVSEIPGIKVDITNLQNAINDIPDISGLYDAMSENKYVDTDLSGLYVYQQVIKTNVNIGSVVDLTPSSSGSYGYILANCNEGDIFTIKGQGGDAPRAWAFVDADNKLIAVSDSYAILDYDDVTAPMGAEKAIFNLTGATAHKVVKHGLEKVPIDVGAINADFVESEQLFDKSTIIAGKKYDNGVITSDSDYYLSDYIPISPSTEYTYRGVNGAINYFGSDKSFLSQEAITTYDQAVQKTSPDSAYYVRLQMRKLYYPYDALTMCAGSVGTLNTEYGKLLIEQKIQKRSYRFSDIPIPTQYKAIGVKAVDGSTGTDFDNENPSLNAVYDAFDSLVTEFPDYITREDLGLDQSGTYHIYAYHFVPEMMEAASTYYRLPYPKIMLMAGIHGGGECCENIFALYYLFKSLCYNWRDSEALDYLRWNVRFAVVPVQNPYGIANKTRQNSRGVDLNRNFLCGWKAREAGTGEYGGTAPMSEAETIAIAAFGKANNDALFTVDLHGTGNSSVPQTSMCYCGTQPTDEIFYLCKSLITKISHYWASENIPGIQEANFNGFISSSIEGDGMQRCYMFGVNKIHAMVLESFKNFQGSSYANNSAEIMQMAGDALGYLLILGLNHFRYLS